MPEKLVYTLREVAEMLDISTNRVWSLVRQGKLPEPIFRTEQATRFRASEVNAALGVKS